MGVRRMSFFCGFAALLLVTGIQLSCAASLPKPKECDGIKTPLAYKNQLEAIFNREGRGASVCENTLLGRTDGLKKGSRPPESLSTYSLMWVFVSDSTVLDKFLDFASEECSGASSQCDRKRLLYRMLNYAGFDNGTIGGNIERGRDFIMVVVDQKRTTDAWNFDFGAFQPKWQELYDYLGNLEGFTVCNDDGCEKQQMPGEFQFTLEGPDSLPNGIRDYSQLTGCGDGFTGPWIRDVCTDYEAMKEQFYDSFCPNTPCGSTACVKIYKDGLSAWAGDLTKQTMWTRAYFEMCMGINQWFTGLGRGYDPENGKVTGIEWLVRGDKAVPSSSLGAEYITLWNGFGNSLFRNK